MVPSRERMTTNYLYLGKNKTELLYPLVAMRRAISESFEAGCGAVRVDSDDVRIMMRHSDSNDSRDFSEKLAEFAQESGFGFEIEDHGRLIRFST